MSIRYYIDDYTYRFYPKTGKGLVYIYGWAVDENGSLPEFDLMFDDELMDIKPTLINRPDIGKMVGKDSNHAYYGFVYRVDVDQPKAKIVLKAKSSKNGKLTLLLDLNTEKVSYFESSLDLKLSKISINHQKVCVEGICYDLNYTPVEIFVEKQNGELEFIQSVYRKLPMLMHLRRVPDEMAFCGYDIEIEKEDRSLIFVSSYSKIVIPVQSILERNQNKRPILSVARGVVGMVRSITSFKTRLSGKARDYHHWILQHRVTKKELSAQKKVQFSYQPKISLIVAAYNTKLTHFDEMIKSVLSQSYENWELCIADGSSNDSVKDRILKKYQKDQRIKYKKLDENLGISGNMNAAIEMSTGDYIAIFDHDDLLEPDALYMVVSSIQVKRYRFIYTDEDKLIDETRKFDNPNFKPDFSIDYLRSVNYICHFVVFDKQLYFDYGFMNSNYDGAQDHDLFLRYAEKISEDDVLHIPRILYHWRMHSLSTASNPESKKYAFVAGQQAISDHLKRCNYTAQVEQGPVPGLYNVSYSVFNQPLVSILIPNKDHIEDLNRCILSILHKATYKRVELIVIENNSTEKETFAYYEKIQGEYPNVKVVVWDKEFNYAAINNFGRQYATGEYLLLLNNDTEVISPSFIEDMLGFCQRESTGAVGIKLLYPDDTVQHGGVILGLGGIAGHAFVGFPENDYGYFGKLVVPYNATAVTAACMMVKTKVFDQVNGFDERFKVAFNDIDLCMKIRELGQLIVFDGQVEMYHYESKSRGMENTPEKVERFRGEIELFEKKWSNQLIKGDPFYNCNLSLESNYELAQ